MQGPVVLLAGLRGRICAHCSETTSPRAVGFAVGFSANGALHLSSTVGLLQPIALRDGCGDQLSEAAGEFLRRRHVLS